MSRWTVIFSAAVLAGCAQTLRPAASNINPLDPLTAEEMKAAVRVVRSSGRAGQGSVLPVIALHEPPKSAVLSDKPVPREALIVVFDRAANRTSEAVVDVRTQKLVSWRDVPGAQAPLTSDDAELADRIVRRDERWQRSVRSRGIRPAQAAVLCWPAGYFARTHEDGSRFVVAVTYERNPGQSVFERPVEGISAIVDLTHARIAEYRDSGPAQPPGDAVPIARREAPKPLNITQPAGVSFTLDGHEVRWQKWRFRWGVNPREGLVLYRIGYEDGGRVRPILYRAAVSEMVVPYGDPDPAWFFRSTFDVGELGIGRTISPLKIGVDCPQNSTVLPAVISDEDGTPLTIPNAVALYERDQGFAWKHGDNARRARELVIGFLTQAGNYDYGFDWIFRQDGSIEVRVNMTGIMAVKGTTGSHDHYGHIVAQNISAIHHQHFFNYRLDFDIDGTSNRLIEMNTESDPPTGANHYGTAFHMTDTVLASELEAKRNVDVAASRRWRIVNSKERNEYGEAPGYILLPGENAFPFTAPGSWIRRRASFIDAHIWATPYVADERYAAGEYPNQSRATEGLGIWTRRNRVIDGADLVVWYTLGVTHLPRPEEWPIMPVHTAGFRLVPAGFFNRNPALDLP